MNLEIEKHFRCNKSATSVSFFFINKVGILDFTQGKKFLQKRLKCVCIY